MKTRIVSKILVSLCLMLVLGSTITQVLARKTTPGYHYPSHWRCDAGEDRFVRPEPESGSVRWNLRKLLCQRHRYAQELIMFRLCPRPTSDKPAPE